MKVHRVARKPVGVRRHQAASAGELKMWPYAEVVSLLLRMKADDVAALAPLLRRIIAGEAAAWPLAAPRKSRPPGQSRQKGKVRNATVSADVESKER